MSHRVQTKGSIPPPSVTLIESMEEQRGSLRPCSCHPSLLLLPRGSFCCLAPAAPIPSAFGWWYRILGPSLSSFRRVVLTLINGALDLRCEVIFCQLNTYSLILDFNIVLWSLPWCLLLFSLPLVCWDCWQDFWQRHQPCNWGSTSPILSLFILFGKFREHLNIWKQACLLSWHEVLFDDQVKFSYIV